MADAEVSKTSLFGGVSSNLTSGTRFRCDMHGTAEMNIIKAHGADTQRIAAFYEALIEKMRNHPYRPKWIKGVYPSYDDIRRHCIDGSFFLAVQHEQILGAIAIVEGGDENHGQIPWTTSAVPEEISTLHLLAVEPEMQGRGIGFMLLKFAEDLCRHRGDTVIRLDTLPENAPGNRLYRKCGYSLVATDTRFYGGMGSIDFNYYELPL